MSDDQKQTPEKPQTEPVAAQATQKNVEMNFRYACPACTNIAFYAEEPRPFQTKTCKSCGKEIGCSLGNYIALTAEEKQRVNQHG